MNLSLVDAFAKFSSIPSNRVRGLSAIAADGAMVLNCSHEYFGRPAQGVLRYEDRLSREATATKCTGLLGEHLTLARDGALPVRMVVMSVVVAEKKRTRSFHVRPDLIGKVVTFDGDHFVIDFTRREELREDVTGRKNRPRGSSAPVAVMRGSAPRPTNPNVSRGCRVEVADVDPASALPCQEGLRTVPG